MKKPDKLKQIKTISYIILVVILLGVMFVILYINEASGQIYVSALVEAEKSASVWALIISLVAVISGVMFVLSSEDKKGKTGKTGKPRRKG